VPRPRDRRVAGGVLDECTPRWRHQACRRRPGRAARTT
jgi:hypothetical protein